MQLKNDIHLAYCTNIHRGQNWAETFETLVRYVLPVRDRVAKGKPYAIGLRLSNQASLELSEKQTLQAIVARLRHDVATVVAEGV